MAAESADDHPDLVVDDDGRRPSTRRSDDLSILKQIARQARAAGARRSESTDPIGDALLDDDRMIRAQR